MFNIIMPMSFPARAPMIIPIISHGGGSLSIGSNTTLSFFIVANLFIITWLIIRYFIAKKADRGFVANMFFMSEDYLQKELNFSFVFLLIINGLWLFLFICDIVENLLK